MKVLFVNPGGGRAGGAERSLALLVRGLLEREHHVSVAVLAPGDLPPALEALGARVSMCPVPLGGADRHGGVVAFGRRAVVSGPRALEVVRWLRGCIRTTSPDIVHSNGFRSHLLTPAIRSRRAPVVWSLRDVPPSALQRNLLRGASLAAAAVVCTSEASAATVSARRRVVVPNPIEPWTDIDPATARRALGLPAERPVVAVLSHLHPSKGHDLLVDAVARMAPRERPLVVIAGGCIYGDASVAYERELRRRIAAAGLDGDITLLGIVDDPALVYAAADAVVVPSRHAEGFGRVVAEAQAAGVPVVAADVGNLPVLARGGAAALLVPPDDVVALRVAVERVLRDGALRSRLVSGGLAVSASLTTDRHVDGVEAVYERVERR